MTTTKPDSLSDGEGGHTPGPWVLEQSEQFPFDLIVRDAAGTEILRERLWAHASGQKTASEAMDGVGFRGAERDEVRVVLARQMADLRLAASAPDLLEALKGLVEEVCDYATINKLGDPEQKHNVKLARAAIAKAEAAS
jgi:hypothetical protein